MQIKQENIIDRYSSLVTKHGEIEYLKTNMNEYLGKNKTDDRKKESVIGNIKEIKIEEHTKSINKKD